MVINIKESGFSHLISLSIQFSQMPYYNIWIHLICSTKKRRKLISKNIKRKLYDHILENAKRKNIYVDHINGIEDHVHLLISLKPDQSVSKVVQLIKGESSYWINKNNIIGTRFEWQEEYMALSVSESLLPNVRRYIRDQEKHHAKKSYKEEFDLFIEKYGFEKFNG